MGANGSSYPHSCSPRIGGNAQGQQTFIGMYSKHHHQHQLWPGQLLILSDYSGHTMDAEARAGRDRLPGSASSDIQHVSFQPKITAI